MGFVTPVIRTLVDYMLPPRCVACGVSVAKNHEFCLDCWEKLEFLAGACCAQCGAPFAFELMPDAKCGQCLSEPPHLDSVRAAVRYGETSARLAIQLKYGGKLGVADLIAGQMKRLIDDQDGPDLIIPVPLHRARLWSRGFNQSVLIAEGLAQHVQMVVSSDLLLRKHATPPLKKMSNAERLRTVKSAFDLTAKGRSLIPDTTVFLVDDVYTSGSTANACARTLKAGGAKKVILLCWARVCKTEE